MSIYRSVATSLLPETLHNVMGYYKIIINILLIFISSTLYTIIQNIHEFWSFFHTNIFLYIQFFFLPLLTV